MNDSIFYLRLCSMLMNGKGISDGQVDAVSADNAFYGVFGMSSEDILENFQLGFDKSLYK